MQTTASLEKEVSSKISSNKENSVCNPLQMKQASLKLMQGENNIFKRPNPLQVVISSHNPLQFQSKKPFLQKENKTGIPDNLKEGVEVLSGYSKDDVNVHYHSDTPAQLHEIMGLPSRMQFNTVLKEQEFSLTVDQNKQFSNNTHSIVQRASTINSLNGAWETLGKPGIVGFLTRVIESSGGINDQSGSVFTWNDLAIVLSTKEGEEFVTTRWRDSPGEKWGVNQTIQGQHEWVPTNNAPRQLANILKTQGRHEALQFLAAADMLRTPTTEVYLGVQPNLQIINKINTASDLSTTNTSKIGTFSHHSQGLFVDSPGHKNKKNEFTNNMVAKGSTSFHKKLDKDVLKFIPGGTLNFEGLLNSMHQHVQNDMWQGQIPGLDPLKAQQVHNDFQTSSKINSEQHGKVGLSASMEASGAQVSYQPARNLYEFQQAASQGYRRNVDINANRTNALMTMHPETPLMFSESQWSSIPKEPVYVNDNSVKSVEDYDMEYEEAKKSNNFEKIKELESDMDLDTEDMSSITTLDEHGPHLPQSDSTIIALNQYELKIQALNTFILQFMHQRANTLKIQLFEVIKTGSKDQAEAQKHLISGSQEIQNYLDTLYQKINIRLNAYQVDKAKLLRWYFKEHTKPLTRQQFKECKDTFHKDFTTIVESYIKDVSLMLT